MAIPDWNTMTEEQREALLAAFRVPFSHFCQDVGRAASGWLAIPNLEPAEEWARFLQRRLIEEMNEREQTLMPIAHGLPFSNEDFYIDCTWDNREAIDSTNAARRLVESIGITEEQERQIEAYNRQRIEAAMRGLRETLRRLGSNPADIIAELDSADGLQGCVFRCTSCHNEQLIYRDSDDYTAGLTFCDLCGAGYTLQFDNAGELDGIVPFSAQ